MDVPPPLELPAAAGSVERESQVRIPVWTTLGVLVGIAGELSPTLPVPRHWCAWMHFPLEPRHVTCRAFILVVGPESQSLAPTTMPAKTGRDLQKKKKKSIICRKSYYCTPPPSHCRNTVSYTILALRIPLHDYPFRPKGVHTILSVYTSTSTERTEAYLINDKIDLARAPLDKYYNEGEKRGNREQTTSVCVTS